MAETQSNPRSTAFFFCRFESLDTSFFEGEIVRAHLPALDGDITLLPSHASLFTFLRPGFVRFVLPQENDIRAFYLSSGFVQLEKGQLRILVRDASLFREETESPFPEESLVFEEVSG